MMIKSKETVMSIHKYTICIYIRNHTFTSIHPYIQICTTINMNVEPSIHTYTNAHMSIYINIDESDEGGRDASIIAIIVINT